MDPERSKEAVLVGRTWAEAKAAHLEGTSPRDWPEEWRSDWSGELHLDPRGRKLDRAELAALLERATDAARERWEEILEAERALAEAGEAGSEERAAALYEALRDRLPGGLSAGREGPRVFLQDISDATEMTVTSYAQAARAIGDWQERHLGH